MDRAEGILGELNVVVSVNNDIVSRVFVKFDFGIYGFKFYQSLSIEFHYSFFSFFPLPTLTLFVLLHSLTPKKEDNA